MSFRDILSQITFPGAFAVSRPGSHGLLSGVSGIGAVAGGATVTATAAATNRAMDFLMLSSTPSGNITISSTPESSDTIGELFESGAAEEGTPDIQISPLQIFPFNDGSGGGFTQYAVSCVKTLSEMCAWNRKKCLESGIDEIDITMMTIKFWDQCRPHMQS